MQHIPFIINVILFVSAAVLTVLFSVHMFQLNSYKPAVQLKWMKANASRFVINILILAGAAAAFLTGRFSSAALAVILAADIIFYLPKKAKKPLVYTNRVKRMMITVAIIYCLFFICVGFDRVNAAMLLGAAIAPFIVLLANLINKPVEKAVNNFYIKDAKKILAAAKNLTVIGVTGSYGKTSVKFYLSTLLQARFNVLMTPESYNTPMGVVKTVRSSLKATHEVFICEMGAKQPGDIKEICDIFSPDHGIVTAIGPQHLESFKTVENIIKTKYELADSLPKEGMLFLNVGSPIIKKNRPAKKGITYGLEKGADYEGFDISVSKGGTEFTVVHGIERERFATQLIGEHNVVNIIGAIAVAHSMGISFYELKSRVRKIEGVPHRLQLIQRGALTIIDDAYNSNPSGTKAALKTLSVFDGFKVLVTPGMIELGDKQDEYNYEFGKDAARVCDLIVLVGENQTKSIYKGAVDAHFDKSSIYVAKGLDDALNYVYSVKCDGDKIVLLENDLPDNY